MKHPNIHVTICYPGVAGHETTTMITEETLAKLMKNKKAMHEFAKEKSANATFKCEDKVIEAFPGKILFSKEFQGSDQLLHTVEYTFNRIEPLNLSHVTKEGDTVSIWLTRPGEKDVRINVLVEHHYEVLKRNKKIVDEIILERLNKFRKKKCRFDDIQAACDELRFEKVFIRSHELGKTFFDLNEGRDEYNLLYKPTVKTYPPVNLRWIHTDQDFYNF